MYYTTRGDRFTQNLRLTKFIKFPVTFTTLKKRQIFKGGLVLICRHLKLLPNGFCSGGQRSDLNEDKIIRSKHKDKIESFITQITSWNRQLRNDKKEIYKLYRLIFLFFFFLFVFCRKSQQIQQPQRQ